MMHSRVAALVVPLLVAGGAALALTTGGDLSAARLQSSIAGTFANLFVDQQTLLGRPGLSAETVTATASCARRGSSSPDRGAGDDWTCVVQWHGVDALRAAVYDVRLRTNGCYTATGPPTVVGPAMSTTTSGRLQPNPIHELDGCFTP
jgi:hypothetical protein